MSRVRVAVASALTVLIVLVLVAIASAYGGWVNVAATHPHLPGVEWFLGTLQENAVETHATRALRAGTLSLPDLSDAALQRQGLATFQSMCVTCHGAPGVERSAIGRGLNPQPPALSESPMSPAGKAWVITHGIRMTGMPAFGPTQTSRSPHSWHSSSSSPRFRRRSISSG